MNFFDRKYFPFFLLFLIVFISRLPFLSAGYGVEEDSWGIALAAFHTKLTGVYEPSRFPGHPVQELIYSALWGSGPFVFNLLCAFFSAVATVFFALILKSLKFNYFFIASLAFAFTPVFFISSTYTIDFAWTITFILIAMFALLKDQLLVCGVFLGLAIGCRITSGAMLLPFMMIIWQNGQSKKNLNKFLKIILPMMVVALLSYLPLIKQFGFSFFMYYDQFPYPPVTKVLYKMIPGTFGLVGTVVMVFYLIRISFLKKINAGELFQYQLSKKIVFASIAVVILFSISYFRLPQKSGYMITVIPFLIIIFGYYLNGRHFIYLCISLILSSFIFSINLTDRIRGAEYSRYAFKFNVSGQELFLDPFSGPIFSDLSKRKQKINYTDEVIRRTDTIAKKTVVIAGWWYNQIMVTMIPMEKNDLVVFESYIDSKKMRDHISNGYEIKYLPEQNIYNDQMFKMRITDLYSSEF